VYPFYDDGGYHYGGSGDDDNSPGGGTDYHQSAEQWTTASIQEDEVSTSLAGAKPNIIENNDRSEVSRVFTPPEIVLYNYGLDSSQAVRLPQTQGGVTTAL